MPAFPILLSITLLSISSFLLPTSGLNHEGLALLSWLSTFNSSPSSSLFSSWNQIHQNPCRWAFITCSKNGLVSEISIKSINLPTTFPTQLLSFNSLTTIVLHDTNITGEIPAEISNLTSLVTLDLSFNNLNGNMPPEIGKLWKLRSLYLNSNSLKGPIPPEISNCSQLRSLELVDNALTGTIPAELGKLSLLETFRAGGNAGLFGEIPVNISQCQGLVFLGLAGTAVSGHIPSSLGELKSLRTLSIYTANLSGTIPPQIANCSALENVFLYQNQLTGEIPADLGLLRNLKSLLLWENSFNGNIPGSLGNCSGLTIMDFSLNSLTGEIPASFSNLLSLEVFLLSYNNISGKIPPFIGNLSSLNQLELDNNRFSGEIPASIGQLKELSQFFAWQNQLRGNIPFEIGYCKNLQSLDLSYNFLSGSLQNSLFSIKSLSKLMLISNGLSGDLPSHIGNCSSLTRLRLGFNRFSGRIPPEIELLRSLTFLELSENQLSGEIPPELGSCVQLEMVDLHENRLQGMIPSSFESLQHLNVLDLSRNRISGAVPELLSKLKSLNKLALNGNYITGSIPKSLGLCKDLQSLDMSSNRLSGPIPDEIGQLQGLDIVLNLSWNSLSGPLPPGVSNLSKLASLDLSHNMLTVSLTILGELGNLVFLDVSYNNFSGYLPDTLFFRQLPMIFLSGNPQLCTVHNECFLRFQRSHSSRRIILLLIFGLALTVVVMTLGTLVTLRAQKSAANNLKEDEEIQEWDFTPFQKLDFSIDEVVKGLLDSNIIGNGSSGVVYRVETRTGLMVAVKKLSPEKNREFPGRDLFTAELKTLGSIRHKNIVRLLGCCCKRNRSSQLLIFDYISNGSLDKLLHRSSKFFLEWDSRYKIALGAAEGLAYLHHDCNPPIIHRDIKANNILIGPQFEAYLADFGLAKLIDNSGYRRPCSIVIGSCGYIAPEYSYSLKITEKSDVYSYGVVLLEILTGMQPTDDRIPGGIHIIEWVRRELRRPTAKAADLLDEVLRNQTDLIVQEMVQVLGVALLCVNAVPKERPTMRDVVALLKEIRLEYQNLIDADGAYKGFEDSAQATACSSFSRSSEPLINSYRC